MVLTAFLLLAPPVQAAAPAEALAQEVVVIGRKRKTWRATFRTGREGLTCRTRTSSGDPEIDALGCAAMTQCWPNVRAKFDASLTKGIANADRQLLQTEANATLTECVSAQHKKRIEALAIARTSR